MLRSKEQHFITEGIRKENKWPKPLETRHAPSNSSILLFT